MIVACVAEMKTNDGSDDSIHTSIFRSSRNPVASTTITPDIASRENDEGTISDGSELVPFRITTCIPPAIRIPSFILTESTISIVGRTITSPDTIFHTSDIDEHAREKSPQNGLSSKDDESAKMLNEDGRFPVFPETDSKSRMSPSSTFNGTIDVTVYSVSNCYPPSHPI
ncbi:hypothetical protein BLNAU_14753 [Blattamonas nauphoetae]|uniref:Uncharacterized protein n=1 Tax=Blattamonas nauphoetae TaxID=2049346 RepID=A0ABQ9XG71_9EUKA|nr:hypothetical protein BLNAU_14753 [Blattamonas nauphoetae]